MITRLILLWSLIVFLASCTSGEPEKIAVNSDNCYVCKMTITDPKFAAEIITDKGRIFKFDDIKCLVEYKNSMAPESDKYKFFFVNFNNSNEFLKADDAWLVTGGEVNTPMQGNALALKSKAEAEKLAKEKNAKVIVWKNLLK